MTIGIIGRKRGMTRVFTAEGESVPVTVIEAEPNRVTRMMDEDKDGYRAIQVAWGSRRRDLINKPVAGVLAKAEVESAAGLMEFRLQENEVSDYQPGDQVRVDIFATGQKVDVTGTSIGKGFAGAIKRHNFRHQRNSHGNSLSHRALGSVGQNQSPGKVFKGKKMAGQMGNVQRTTQNLEVLRVDTERNLLLLKGAIPGAKGGKVIVKSAVKAGNRE